MYRRGTEMREKMAAAFFLTAVILSLTELVPESATYGWMLASYALKNWFLFYGMGEQLANMVAFVISPIAIFGLVWLACLALLLCINDKVEAE